MTAAPVYRERLGVPLRWWVQVSMLIATLWLAMVVAIPDGVAWAVTAACVALMGLCLWSYGNARIVVTEHELRAGRAHIERRHLGSVQGLDAEQTRRIAGVEADARAYLLLRPYLRQAVKVEITDPADPAPYWLIATRRPDDLAGALGRTVGGSLGTSDTSR